MSMVIRHQVCCIWALAIFSTACKPPPPATAPVVRKQLTVTGAGGALERVTSEPVTERYPAIAPDGRVLLFCVEVYDELGESLQQSTLVGVEPNTRAQRTLFTSTASLADHPAWLPNQSSYVYSSNSPGQWSLVRALTAAPNAAVNVVASGEIAPVASWPTLSPDGKRVALMAQVRGQWNLATIGLDGSQLTLLGEGERPAWSPDGNSLAFIRQVGDHTQMFILNPHSGTDLVQLTSGEYDHWSPTWSPDGQYLAFATNRGWNRFQGGTPKRIWNLFIVRRDGTGLTQLTDGNAMTIDPNWGTDSWIYFASDQAGNLDIWRLRPAGEYAMLQPVAPPAETLPAGTVDHSPPKPGSAPAPSAPANSGSGCSKDTDCKGDRVCNQGRCVAP